ncbi:MAG: bifunctional 4-hydroxy-3-methylbut-2-enyl diphosphate reductase/30S ribosomal protein S1 [Syntrophomonadaceae bacterium]|nr:bifunctional 4-hydroxy-3-methylbut-2-enyl diphosphate reductase/30S ribosomal protein S1 [Syntrophomonadaceae bacterium]
MRIIVAKYAGCCFGVKRAISMAEKALLKNPLPVYTIGPLVHNPQLVQKLFEKGLIPVECVSGLQKGTVVIRSHGVSPDILEKLKDYCVVDATCPHVAKAQRAAKEFQEQGYQVVIIGDRNHPEVVGLNGWAHNQAIIVGTLIEASGIKHADKIGVVAQTTFDQLKYNHLLSILKEKTTDLRVSKTICDATQLRQAAVRELAVQVDILIVVGGFQSSNTQKLYAIGKEAGIDVYQVEQAEDLVLAWFSNKKRAGVAAGASTPDWIIEEVVRKMNEFSGEKQLEDSGMTVAAGEFAPENADVHENKTPAEDKDVHEFNLGESMKSIRKGDILKGTVIQINTDEVLVDIGGKSEGVIPLGELSNRPAAEPHQLVRIGDTIEVYVLRLENEEGHPVLSKKRADRKNAWEKIEDARHKNMEINAPVVEVVKGGLLVDVGINGFVPASLIERGYVENLENYLGKVLRLKVIELDRSKNKVILSQKAILDEEYERRKADTWNALEKGQVYRGQVRRLTNFGAFIDIGGVDGLLHVSEMSWGRIDHPRSVMTEGQEIDVIVLGVDRGAGKVSLGRKQLLANPWSTADEKYIVGSIFQGKVLRIAPFGAFVELESGIEGLVHISQLADRHVAKTEDVVSVGQIIPVKVLSVDLENQRISLSLREAIGSQNQETKDEPDEAIETKQVKLGDIFAKELGELMDGKDED